VLIYVTIKAQPEQLASNLAFIERYRMQSRLVSESAYFFVQMVRQKRSGSEIFFDAGGYENGVALVLVLVHVP
jgi:hypothetical protein